MQNFLIHSRVCKSLSTEPSKACENLHLLDSAGPPLILYLSCCLVDYLNWSQQRAHYYAVVDVQLSHRCHRSANDKIGLSIPVTTGQLHLLVQTEGSYCIHDSIWLAVLFPQHHR